MPDGRLVVCATPIGNLGDISERLRNALAAADVIFAEDTRRTAKLLRHLVISVPVVSLFTGNETSRTQRLVESVRNGDNVVLVSDAGMPTISDPGAAAIRAVRDAGLAVTVVPGPSAVTMAMALSGLGGDRFAFEGFLPRRGAERERRLDDIAADGRPVVFFASPNRLGADLADLLSRADPGRRVAVMRELTKLHEECWVGSLEDAVARWSEPVKGEVTVVLGPSTSEPVSLDTAVEMARSLVAEGVSVRESAREVAESTGVSRRDVYEALIANQGEG